MPRYTKTDNSNGNSIKISFNFNGKQMTSEISLNSINQKFDEAVNRINEDYGTLSSQSIEETTMKNKETNLNDIITDEVTNFEMSEEHETILNDYKTKILDYIEELSSEEKVALQVETQFMRKLLDGKPLD